MLTINLIREKKDLVIERLKVKILKQKKSLKKFLHLILDSREIQTKTDLLQAEMNRISKEIGFL